MEKTLPYDRLKSEKLRYSNPFWNANSNLLAWTLHNFVIRTVD